MNLSPTVIIGNITADPELVFLPSGTPKATFSVAVNYVWYDDKNAKQEKVSFINVVAWRWVAENFARVAEKGIGVMVYGRLEQRSYDDKEGNKRSVTELVAEDIAILTRSIESIERRKASNTEGAAAPKQAAQPQRQRAMAGVGVETESEPF